MIIDRLELFKVPPRWLFVKVTTRSGLSGWGEPVLEGRTDSVAAAVKDLEEYVIGSDASRIEDLYTVLTKGGFYRPGPVMMSAISGLEQALWDIKGKALGVPVHELLGGAVRDKIKVYGWVGGDSPEDAVHEAQKRIEMGYAAIKTNLCGKAEWIVSRNETKKIIKYFRNLRSAVGDDAGIAIDFHGRVHRTMLKYLMKELEEFYPMFYEEPLLPEFVSLYGELGKMTTVPLACGERLVGREAFKEVIEGGGVAIIQPDISHAGGIWELRKIAAWAEIYDIAIAPHCPLGPLAFSASLQLNSCTPNAILLETSAGIHYNNGVDMLDYLHNKEDFNISGGFVQVPRKPGLGVEINEEYVRKMVKTGHNWRNPVWRGDDGSFLEW
jgi:galactonate dehydratase